MQYLHSAAISKHAGSPSWHRRLRRKRSAARLRVHKARSSGEPPSHNDLIFLRRHHTAPAFRELALPMGKKAAWEESRQPYSSSSSWQQHGGVASRWDKNPKGHGRKGKDHWQETAAPSFPSFEDMSAKGHRPIGQLQRRGDAPGQEATGTGFLVHFIQKLANTIRRADGKLRKCEEEGAATEAKWEEYQKELKRSFLQERKRRAERIAKVDAEQAELLQQKENAIAELQAVFLNPQEVHQQLTNEAPSEALQEWDELMRAPDDPWEALPDLLAGALGSGQNLQETARQQLLGALGIPQPASSLAETAPRTPPNRGTRPAPTTPIMKKSESETAEPPSTATTTTYSGMDGHVLRDPYQTSPSNNRAPQPTRSRSRSHANGPRVSLKSHLKGPVQTLQHGKLSEKLDEKRAAAAVQAAKGPATGQEIEEILDEEEDEEMPVSSLGGQKIPAEPGEE